MLFLRAKPGMGVELVRLYRELAIFELAAEIPGFIEGELLRDDGDPDSLVVRAAWTTPEAYESWLQSAVRAELSGELEPLLSGDPEITRWSSELSFAPVEPASGLPDQADETVTSR